MKKSEIPIGYRKQGECVYVCRCVCVRERERERERERQRERERDYVIYMLPGAREPGGGQGGPPTFCLNGMDMHVPPPLNFGNH